MRSLTVLICTSLPGAEGFPRVPAGGYLPPSQQEPPPGLQGVSWSHQGLSAGACHEVQDHPRSSWRYSGPLWRCADGSLLCVPWVHWNPQRWHRHGHPGWVYTSRVVLWVQHHRCKAETKQLPNNGFPFPGFFSKLFQTDVIKNITMVKNIRKNDHIFAHLWAGQLKTWDLLGNLLPNSFHLLVCPQTVRLGQTAALLRPQTACANWRSIHHEPPYPKISSLASLTSVFDNNSTRKPQRITTDTPAPLLELAPFSIKAGGPAKSRRLWCAVMYYGWRAEIPIVHQLS